MGRLKEFLLGTRLNQADNDLSLALQLEAQYYQYTEQRKKWTTEQKNAENSSIAEWERLHKPNKQNTNLKFD
tara:strand:+ start:1656 stop:1871 length:216 start_codon:yes stop_codon:yes gene_type:complete